MKTGITAHLIDSGCDTGSIIEQIEIDIEYNDTGGILLGKYAKEYFPLVKKVLSSVELNQLTLKKQIELNASYFGKRTPLDGEINWSWSKEDIRNWVRAQAFPYPGAFTFYDNLKIIIDKVSIHEGHLNTEISNGTLLKLDAIIVVKVSNGYLKLDSVRAENCTFVEGKIFGNENRR